MNFPPPASGQWRPNTYRPDDTAVDSFPPVADQVLADVAAWAPADVVPPQVPEPVPPYGYPGKRVWYRGVEIVPWYGPLTERWWAMVPSATGHRLVEAPSEAMLLGDIGRIVQGTAIR